MSPPRKASTLTRARNPDDFNVAIICALPLEADAVEALLDETYVDGPNTRQPTKQPEDANAYTFGRMGCHHVILVHMPGPGKRAATSVATNLRHSFRNVKIALVVGICGGVPFIRGAKREASTTEAIVLGDVVISDGVVEYDFWKKLPDCFQQTDVLRESLGRPNQEIRGLLSKLKTRRMKDEMATKLMAHLQTLQAKVGHHLKYPGPDQDLLFDPAYRHRHHQERCSICAMWTKPSDPVCKEALEASCEELGCDERLLISRDRLRTSDFTSVSPSDTLPQPAVHIGTIASGDTVMKSGVDRDTIASWSNVIAFEMEGAGVWGILPCIVVKGVCDYADCHKNKQWQKYAAGTAAACTKGILEEWSSLHPSKPDYKVVSVIPFERNERFVGRERELDSLEGKTGIGTAKPQRAAIIGLGGIGKTALALELAYRAQTRDTNCSIFWIPSADEESFHQAYINIGQQLEVPGISDPEEDAKKLIKDFLSDEKAGDWLMILDNADDINVWFEQDKSGVRLIDYVPKSDRGSTVMTTRNRHIAVKFAPHGIVSVDELDANSSAQVLRSLLINPELIDEDSAATNKLLEHLAFLPLAIVQAAAYINMVDISITSYLDLLDDTEDTLVEVLSEDFEDQGRYPSQKNPIATTWLISFEDISKRKPLAADLLAFMSCLEPRQIPAFLLPLDEKGSKMMKQQLEAISTLAAYSFVKKKLDQTFDMHRLVHVVMQNWLKSNGSWEQWIEKVIRRLSIAFPIAQQENRQRWRLALPHARHVLFLNNKNKGDNETEDALALQEKMAEALIHENRYDEALNILLELQRTSTKQLGMSHPIMIRIIGNLALLYQFQDQLSEAEKYHFLAIDAATKAYGEEHPDTLHTVEGLASTYYLQYKHAEAESLFRQLLKKADKQQLQEVLLLKFRCMSGLGVLYLCQGRVDEAINIQTEVVENMNNIRGPEHHDTLTVMVNLATTFTDAGRLEDAEKLLITIIEKFHSTLGEHHTDTLSTKGMLAEVYTAMGRYEDAEEMERSVLDGHENILGANHTVTIRSAADLGVTLRRNGRLEEAEELQIRVLESRKKKLGEADRDTLEAMHALALTRKTLGRGEAQAEMKICLELRKLNFGDDDDDTKASQEIVDEWEAK